MSIKDNWTYIFLLEKYSMTVPYSESSSNFHHTMDSSHKKMVEEIRAEISETHSESIEVVKRARTGSMCRLHQPSNFEPMLATPAATSIITKIGAFNKDTAFSEEERNMLGLRGLLPTNVETIDQQLSRCLQQMRAMSTDLDRYVYLSSLCTQNETIFYRLIMENLKECMPIVYTPTVGEACQKFSQIYRHNLSRGMYLSLQDRGQIRKILDNWIYPKVDIVVVTDGSRILGLGDLGLNGMGIPIGKLHLYVAGGGFHPTRTLPIVIDVGTSNATLRADPTYLGLRQERCSDDVFYSFMDEFMVAVQDKWPSVLVQFEDFSNNHCFDLLDRFRYKQLCFNDDIQGTGAVILAGFINACKLMNIPMRDQRIVFFGAGSAAIGVADQMVYLLKESGLSDLEARRRFWFVDSKGLVTIDKLKKLNNPAQNYKIPYARDDIEGENVPCDNLLDTIQLVRPTGLIGLSGIANSFTESVVKRMKDYNAHPLIFALSNPTKNAECSFENAIRWTNGNVIFASGSPFHDVTYEGNIYKCAQGNNMYIFPGLGLGASLSKSRLVTDTMVVSAAKRLASCVDDKQLMRERILYPELKNIREISLKLAVTVIEQAYEDKMATLQRPKESLEDYVHSRMYFPEYLI